MLDQDELYDADGETRDALDLGGFNTAFELHAADVWDPLAECLSCCAHSRAECQPVAIPDSSPVLRSRSGRPGLAVKALWNAESVRITSCALETVIGLYDRAEVDAAETC